jgi:hypothetical protein
LSKDWTRYDLPRDRQATIVKCDKKVRGLMVLFRVAPKKHPRNAGLHDASVVRRDLKWESILTILYGLFWVSMATLVYHLGNVGP